MTKRSRASRALLLASAATLCGCGADFFGSPPRVATHGFRATASIVADGRTVSTFELAASGDDVRAEQPGGAFPVYVRKGKEGRAFEIDPATKRWRDADPSRGATLLTNHPLSPGFDAAVEAARRGLERYSRESDTVFAGNACEVWRFDDDPDADVSPAAWFWVSPSHDRLVLRRDREEVRRDGTREKVSTQLVNVRVGAAPSLFEVPKGYAKAG